MSFAWINGQYQQVGLPSQSTQAASQFSHDTMRNQQTGTANTSNQYMTAQTGVRPPQIAKFTHHYGANSKIQPSNWQTSAVPHQVVSFQQTAGGNNYLQHSPTNLQSGNPSLQATYGLQLHFHQNSAQNSSTQSPPNVTLANIVYSQQDIAANWNQSVGVHGKQPVRTQNANIVSDRHHCRDQNSYNINGESIKPVPSTATSPQDGEVAYIGTLWPAAAHQRPTAQNDNRRQNGTPHGFTPPSYNEAIAQSFRNDSKTTNSSSSGHNFCVSSTGHISPQYSTHTNGGEATSSINSNSYNGQYEPNLSLSKPNDSPLTPAVGALQEMLRCQNIARIEDYLRTPFTAGSDGRPQVYIRSPSGRKQNMQPVMSTVTEICNANAAQSTPQNSGHSLPKTAHSVNVPPQQSGVTNVFATRDGIGYVSQAAFFPENMRSLSDAPQLMRLLDGITPRRNEKQSSVANNCERLEMLSVKANDCSLHSSPACRAVAVVQPLSQKSYQVASKQTSSNPISQLSEATATDESLSNPEKLFMSPKNQQIGSLKVGPYLHPENPNQMRSNKYANWHLAASNDGTFVSSSSSAGPQDLLQKQLCTVEARSKVDIDTRVHQRVAPTAQQSVAFKVPVSQNGDKDKSEMPIDTKRVLELSSVPTTPWTPVALTKYIQDTEKAQMELKDFTMCGAIYKLLTMFWDGDPESLKYALKTGMYNTLMADVKQFCNEHVTLKSEILSQVKSCFGKHLKSYHVLKDKEVYSELPYKSSWLNVNEQLDDIDKEFDFPQSLKHHLLRLKSDSQPDQVETDDSISAQSVNEVSNKMLSSTELKQVDPSEEKHDDSVEATELKQVDPSEEKHDSSVEATSTQTASPNKTESADSSDPYSFKIQVFPPEDAKVIFEQAQSNLPSMDMDYQPERALNSTVEGELPKVIDATLSNSKLENKTFCPIEEVCCIEMWKETILGTNPSSLSKCQCNIEQSHKDITAKTLDKEVMAVQEKDTFRSDSKFHSATEGENQTKGGESVNTFHWPEIFNVFSYNFDFPEDDDPHSDNDPKNIDQISINSSQSSIIFISDDEEHLPSSESEILNQMPDFENDSEQATVKLTESGQSGSSGQKETNKISRNDTEIQSEPEVECVPDQLKSTGNMQPCTSGGSDKKTVASQTTDLDENLGQVQLTSTNVAESSLKTEEEQTQISATGVRQKTWSGKRKRSSCPDRFLPVLKKPKKCKSLVDVNSKPILESASKCGTVCVHATDGKPSASNCRTVELVLFGSTQDKCVLLGSRTNHISPPEAASDAELRPPKVLTVNISPLKREHSFNGLTWKYSVKRLCKKWKIRFPPAKIRPGSKLKAQKCTFASSAKWSHKKAGTIGPAETEELPVSSEMRILRRKTKRCTSLSWRRSLTEELECEEEKTEKRTVMLNQPADQERNNDENGRNANDALKFTVLPVSFNFGSNGIKETKDPVPGKPDLVEGKDNSHNKAVMERGSWYPIAENERSFSPATPKTYSLFHMFQKKYMKTIQPNVDK
ncbi:protein AMN1 homolog [Anarrhichthys ocellatus]|uniref:protein AMN1 homolog n=1 Tax=Anarrhichthys ocellatus TaxID=433405 RepID=UPI0012ED7951|nr:uncharacterized protein LOC116396191 [Anarrhichthys ocellatus]